MFKAFLSSFFFFSFLSCQKVVLSLQQHFSYLWNISTLIRPGMAGQQFPEPIVGRHWCDSMSLAYSLNFKAYWEASFMNCVERFMWPVKTIYKIPILKGKLILTLIWKSPKIFQTPQVILKSKVGRTSINKPKHVGLISFKAYINFFKFRQKSFEKF